jgi:hypothetical protein
MEVVVQLTAQQEQALRAAAETRWPGLSLEAQLAEAFAEQCREELGGAEEGVP